MKSQNIQKIMAIAKAEKTVWKIVISVDKVSGDGTIIKQYTCIDEWNNTFECDELEESRVQTGKTLSIHAADKEIVDELLRLGQYTEVNNQKTVKT